MTDRGQDNGIEDDGQLLARYAGHGDQAAFAELARRHAGLVYSAARRRLRDPDLAHDVTQIVFMVLARKAASIRPDAVLSAWLLKATGYAAKNMNKTELRRDRHEFAAAAQTTAPAAEREDGADWDRVAPLLDEALDSLGESARSAVVLRWFEGRSFSQVGERLGLSEAAAKQKVFRAIGRMRAYFARRGVTVPATALTALVASNAVQPAPAATLQAAVAAGTPAVAATTSAAAVNAVSAMMGWTWHKILAGFAAAMIALAGSVVAVRFALGEPTRTRTVAAPATRAASAAAVRPAGSVFTHDGWPLKDASVLSSTVTKPAVYRGRPDAAAVLTAADGRFDLPPVDRPFVLVIWHETAGFAGVTDDQLAQSDGRIELLPWARVEGTITTRGAPAANAPMIAGHWTMADGRPEAITCELETKADADGRFVFTRVPAGDGWVGRRVSDEAVKPVITAQRTYLTVLPAGQASLQIGGASGSRAVIGKVAADGGQAGARWRVELVRAPDGAGRPAYHGVMFQAGMPVAPDGSFRADDVPPGSYRLSIRGQIARPNAPPLVSSVERDVEISAANGGVDGIRDLGTISLRFPTTNDTAEGAR